MPDQQKPTLAEIIKDDESQQGCELQQLTVFDCDKEILAQKGIIKCYPIPRIFRVCKNRPAVEVTSLLQYKDASGEPTLPTDYLNRLPQGQAWKPKPNQNHE